MPAIQVFVRCFSCRVVAAGEHDYFMVQPMADELLNYSSRKFGKESKVVFRVYNQRFFWPAGKVPEIRYGADGAPQIPQPVEVNLRFQSFTDVTRRLPVPNNIRNVCGGVIERCYLNARIMRCGKERIAGTQARANDSKSIEALLFQPIETATDIDHCLAASIERAADVC